MDGDDVIGPVDYRSGERGIIANERVMLNSGDNLMGYPKIMRIILNNAYIAFKSAVITCKLFRVLFSFLFFVLFEFFCFPESAIKTLAFLLI